MDHNREVVLHKDQLLGGAAGGVLSAALYSIVTKPDVDKTFVITDGTVAETYTFKAAHEADFQVAIGASAATAQTALVAEINARSTRWAALETANLGRFFAAAYPSQFIVRRKAISYAPDRVYGVQTSQAGIKVVSFAGGDYSTASATESNLPATDPGARTFGFARAFDNLSPAEEHRSVNGAVTYAWSQTQLTWRPVTTLDDLANAEGMIARDKVLTPVTLSGTSAEIAISAVGPWLIWSNCDCHYRQGATGGTAVTTDALLAASGEQGALPIYVDDATLRGFVQAITDGGGGKIWARRIG